MPRVHFFSIELQISITNASVIFVIIKLSLKYYFNSHIKCHLLQKLWGLLVSVLPAVISKGRGPIGSAVLYAGRSGSNPSDLVVTAPESYSSTGPHARRVGFLT